MNEWLIIYFGGVCRGVCRRKAGVFAAGKPGCLPQESRGVCRRKVGVFAAGKSGCLHLNVNERLCISGSRLAEMFASAACRDVY